MARQTSPHRPHLQADTQGQQWDDADWDVADQYEDAPHEHDEAYDPAAGQRTRRLLSHADSHDGTSRGGGLRSRAPGGRLIKRVVLTLTVLILVLSVGFAGLWWRLGAGPINLDLATPWLAAAIEDNIGHGNTVEVGGTQIERAGRIRIAVRIRDIIVRDQDHAIVASAPKAEVRLSGAALLMGQLRAESLKLVDAELAIRITPDGTVTVSTGETNKPLATGVASKRDAGLPPTFPRPGQPITVPNAAAPPSSAPVAQSAGTSPAGTPPAAPAQNGLLAGLDWLDSLSLTGLDGQNLNEIGLKNGVLIVDDQQRGNKWTFENISLSLRRPSGGGVALSLGEEGAKPWQLRVLVGPQTNGVRSIDIKADKVSTSNILLAMRLKDLTYMADLPMTGEIKGELARDGLPTYLRGKINIGAGKIIDTDTPDYPMAIDSAEISMDWDAGRRVLVAPFRVISGANRITLNANLEPPNDAVNDWRLGLNSGTIVLGAIADEAPLIFNRISINFRFDTEGKRVLLTQAEVSNGEIGVAGTGSVDYAGEPRLKLGFAATPMPALAMKRIWPALIVPEVRAWMIERIERGNVQRIDIAVNSPTRNLPRKGPPIPDDGLDVNVVATNVTVRPVDGLPAVRDADMKAHVTGRTATVTVGQGVADTPAGRKLNFSDLVFEVPDMAPKPSPSRVRMRVDGPVAAAAEILSSDRLNDLSSFPIDPNQTKGEFKASINLAMPVKGELTKADTNYTVTADLSGFSADKLVMNQKLEANTLKIVASTQGYQVKGDVKINGQPASLDYRKPNEGDADIKMQAILDDASRARLGVDLGTAISGNVPLKLNGKIAGSPDRDSRLGVEADLTQLKLDNLLPGWVKNPGKSSKATFNVVAKPQSTRFEDINIEGGGVSIKGSLEIDQNGDLMNANFPTYSPSEGDKTQLKAERGQDGVLKLSMRGDVFDGRGFLKSAISGSNKDADKNKARSNLDFDAEVKLGAVAGYNGEALRSVDVKLSRRGGAFKSFNLSGKVGRDTPVTADIRVGREAPSSDPRARRQGREVIYLVTNDAGALLRFADTYSKMAGGELELAMEPPTADTSPKEGLAIVRNFTVRGEQALDRAASGATQPASQGIAFTMLRAEFTRQNGLLSIRDGVVKGPTLGLTIEGSIDYNVNQVRASGTIVPLYGLNNMFNQIPIVGLFLGGSNEGLFGVTYEVVGTPSQPVVRINPISAMLPGVTRKIMDFNTGKQQYPPGELPPNN
ncbi:YhdP family protein [Bradyrhizobium sp. HKCCYLR20261]|uniref:YhdP family protein n=1 Tax=Bradyrhizobium sp. HKCCYLR20261 TaxID=3420760 RepID=UPI003EB6D19C